MIPFAPLLLATLLLADDNPIQSGAHKDEGPADRYAVPYMPITYGREATAPLPDLTMAADPVDWDGDGLTDLVVLERRGGGLKLYRNVGTPGEPIFEPPFGAPRLMDQAEFGGFGWCVVTELGGERAVVAQTKPGLTAFFDDGDDPMNPTWRAVPLLTEAGEPLGFPGRFRYNLGDLTGDGREDLVVAIYDETKVTDLPLIGNRRLRDFPEPQELRPYVGELWLLENVTSDPDRPTFAAPRVVADGIYLRGYPAVVDFDGDGTNELLTTTEEARIRVYAADGEGGFALAAERAGPLNQDPRVRLADFGEGPELLYTGYAGDFGPYVRAGLDGEPFGELQMRARADTPVSGYFNSTADVVDFDGDGDRDLLLGGEPGVPVWYRNVGTDDAPAYDAPRRLNYVDGTPLETFCIIESPTRGSFWGPLEWYHDRLAPRAVDWNGDGVLDLVSGSMGRRVYFFKGVMMDGELRFERPQNFRLDRRELDLPDRLFPGVLDWDGDGRLDLILSNDAGHVLMYPGDGTLDLGEPTRLGDIVLFDFWDREKGNRSGFDVADWTGDGVRDLVIYQFHRGVFLFRGLDDGGFGEEKELVKLYSHLAGPTVYDYDRDGVPDLVIGGDERRMIEPAVPAHVVVFRGGDTGVPPGE